MYPTPCCGTGGKLCPETGEQVVFLQKKDCSGTPEQSESYCKQQELCFLLVLHCQYLTAVVQFTFVPVGTVEKVWLSGGRTSRDVVSLRFVVGAALSGFGFGLTSLGMCHFLLFYRLTAFYCKSIPLNASHRGSVESSSSLISSSLSFFSASWSQSLGSS